MQNLDISTMNADGAAVLSLRRCGHFLHHSAGADKGKTNAELMAALTEEEKKTLAELLQKCLRSWETR
ncbi:MAG: hypothetical protein ACI3WR_05995 [Oscillospiraceae bacterium]